MSDIDLSKYRCKECDSQWFEILVTEEGVEIICVSCGKKADID